LSTPILEVISQEAIMFETKN